MKNDDSIEYRKLSGFLNCAKFEVLAAVLLEILMDIHVV
jgi:hypothetical protein